MSGGLSILQTQFIQHPREGSEKLESTSCTSCPRAEESFQYCDNVTIEISIFIFELEIIKIDPVNIRLIGLNSSSDHVWLILLEQSISTLIALGNSW